MIYTSGTTGPPKGTTNLKFHKIQIFYFKIIGVVTTHEGLEAQVTSLVQAWEWTNKDYILQVYNNFLVLLFRNFIFKL